MRYRQFLRTEVAVMRLIHHANVVQFIDVYDSSQYLYVGMVFPFIVNLVYWYFTLVKPNCFYNPQLWNGSRRAILANYQII